MKEIKIKLTVERGRDFVQLGKREITVDLRRLETSPKWLLNSNFKNRSFDRWEVRNG